MRIGIVSPTSEHGTLDALIGDVSNLRDAGMASVWFTQSTGFDALTLIATVGREVRDVVFGTSVVPLYSIHPVRLAQQARTANEAVGGRLVLGIGVSHKVAVEGRMGLRYESPARYLRECVEILRPLLDGEPVDINGSLVSAHLRLAALGRGGTPLLVSAIQPRMLEIAGTVASGTITWCCGRRSVQARIAPTIQAAASGAGRPDPQIVVALPVCVTDDEPAGRQAANQLLAGYERLPVYRAVLDEEGASLPGDISVVGDQASVRRQLEGFAEAGCTTFAAIRCGTEADRARTVELLADLEHEWAPVAGSGTA